MRSKVPMILVKIINEKAPVPRVTSAASVTPAHHTSAKQSPEPPPPPSGSPPYGGDNPPRRTAGLERFEKSGHRLAVVDAADRLGQGGPHRQHVQLVRPA